MNAIPPKGLTPEPKTRRGAKSEDADHVRLTMDYDDEPTPDPALHDGLGGEADGEPDGHQHDSGTDDASRKAAGKARATGHTSPAHPQVPPQLAGIEVRLSVEVGGLRLPLKDLIGVEPGQLFPLDRMTAEPVSVLVNGSVYARGEIVAIGERYGVRLLDIIGEGIG